MRTIGEKLTPKNECTRIIEPSIREEYFQNHYTFEVGYPAFTELSFEDWQKLLTLNWESDERFYVKDGKIAWVSYLVSMQYRLEKFLWYGYYAKKINDSQFAFLCLGAAAYADFIAQQRRHKGDEISEGFVPKIYWDSLQKAWSTNV